MQYSALTSSTLLLALLTIRSLNSFQWSNHPKRRYSSTTLWQLRQQQQPATTIQESHVLLSTGIKAQVLFCMPQSPTIQPPIVFLHGSFHASWCWAEHYFDYFASLGYPVAALSLRGTGSSFAGEGVTKVTIEQHVSDLRSYLQLLPDVLGTDPDDRPVLVAHSFGGLTVMKYLELHPDHGLAGVVTMCSVPPSGNGPMTLRFLKRSLVDSYKITVGFVLKRCIVKDDLCRDLFFGGNKVVSPDGQADDFGISDDDLHRYQSNFARDTTAIIDVSALLQSLPSKAAVDGKAPYLAELPPCLVIGASRDFIVDQQGVLETAEFLGVDPPLFVDSPHDVMLGRNWKNGAAAIHDFIQSQVKK